MRSSAIKIVSVFFYEHITGEYIIDTLTCRPQIVAATAQVLLHRFYYLASIKQHPVMKVTMGCVFLASKIEENHRRLRDLINVFYYLRHQLSDSSSSPYEPIELHTNVRFILAVAISALILNIMKEYYAMRNEIIEVEELILTHLGFHVQCQHPHPLLLCYLKQLDLVDSQPKVCQLAWQLLNDSFRCDFMVIYQPSTIACTMIWMALAKCGVALQSQPAWWEMFDSTLEEMENIGARLLNTLTRRLLCLTGAQLEKFL